MDGLPFIPGFHFNDITKTKYHLSSQFRWKNGYALPKEKSIGIGKDALDVDSILYAKTLDVTGYNPTLIYGRAKDPPKLIVQSRFVKLDGKCLSFKGFTKQIVPESQMEKIRVVKIIYFLVDDTISIVEPVLKNAGYVQGKLLKRCQIPNPNRKNRNWHWTDFNIGLQFSFYGVVYTLCSCDSFTKQYLVEKGVVINPEISLPEDPYMTARRYNDLQQLNTLSTQFCNKPVKDHKFKQFLEYDGKVLRFYAVWIDRGIGIDLWKYFVLFYFLADDRIGVYESKDTGDMCGRSQFPQFLGKIKLPKDWSNLPVNFPYIYLEHEHQACYQPTDLIIGKTVNVMGRNFLLYDCDSYTREYYKTNLNTDQPDPLHVNDPANDSPREYEKKVPPYTGIGDPDDTWQNCFSLRPKPPKTDFITYVLNATKKLRYRLKLVPVNDVDTYRNFIMEFCLGNDHMTIAEVPSMNSGFIKGRFMSSIRLRKPYTFVDDNQFYGTKDFALGSEIHVRGSVFKIVEMDEWTYNYMKENQDMFTQSAIDGAKHFFENKDLGGAHQNKNIKKQNIITLKIYD